MFTGDEDYHEIYYDTSRDKGCSLKEHTEYALSTMDASDVFTFTSITNEWGDMHKLSYFRTIVSSYGKETGKRFAVKELDPRGRDGCKSLAKVKRLK